MKFVDLSANPPAEVTILVLREVAHRVEGKTYGANVVFFEGLVKNPEINTPAPDYTISNVDYWKPETVDKVWKPLYVKEIQMEQERKVRLLESSTVTKMSLIDELIKAAEYVVKRNSRSGARQRGNTLADGRRRVMELEGQINFVDSLLSGQMPKEKRIKLNAALAQAKSSVDMQ
jgi:hypothetical protein